MSKKEKSTAKKYKFEILNSDVNIENIIEQRAEVFLQGVAVDLLSEL